MGAHDNTAVIIYQMGKVGSTTIHKALEAADLPFPIYKVHFLSDEGMAHGETFHQKTLKVPWESTPHIQTSRLLRDKISSDPSARWQIITLVREPIGRELSEFFQYVHSLYPELLDEQGEIDKKRALRMLRTKFMFYKPESSYTARWFDMEIKQMFGIDVYDHPFDRKAGYTVIKQGNVELLTLRLEDLDDTFMPAVTPFLNVETPIPLARSNVRSEQKRGDAYREIIEDFKVRPAICERIYASKYATHFYSEAERAQFAQKWSGA